MTPRIGRRERPHVDGPVAPGSPLYRLLELVACAVAQATRTDGEPPRRTRPASLPDAGDERPDGDAD